MLVSDILKDDLFQLINKGDINNKINNVFACDLLSHAMGFAEENDLLITVLNNVNVLGVASLLDFSGVVFSHNINVGAAVLAKANELGIPLIKTSLTTAQAVVKIRDMRKDN
jgi:hypothetical protein